MFQSKSKLLFKFGPQLKKSLSKPIKVRNKVIKMVTVILCDLPRTFHDNEMRSFPHDILNVRRNHRTHLLRVRVQDGSGRTERVSIAVRRGIVVTVPVAVKASLRC